MSLTVVKLMLIPVISALIGWATNVLAVRMLFRPRRPIRILGWEMQGLVPRRQADLAASIGHTVERHLVSHEDVRRILALADVSAGVEGLLRERIGEFVNTHLKGIHPMAAMFLTESTRQKIEALFFAEVRKVLPEIGTQMVDSVEEQLNFQKMVEEKIRAFDLDRLERMILEIAGREPRAIELLGGVLGFLIGLVQLAIIAI